jgi:hypothetical protein
MDVSLDHKPTLIKRGTGVHLNLPLTAQRGICDSRPARWESWTPHPSILQKNDEGAYKQVGEITPIASNGPRLGGSTHGYTSWRCTERRRVSYTCARHCRGRLKHHRCRMKLTPCTLTNVAEKTLQEHRCSYKASGATPAGALARPHETAQQPGWKNVPSTSASLCGFLTDTTAEARGLLSGTTIRVP